MSTTRHLINRQRRLTRTAAPAPGTRETHPDSAPPVPPDTDASSVATEESPPPPAQAPTAARRAGTDNAAAPETETEADTETGTAPATAPDTGSATAPATETGTASATSSATAPDTGSATAPATETDTASGTRTSRGPLARLRSRRLVAGLGVAVVLLGGFAVYAGARAAELRERPSVRNTALTDVARTSELKGQITRAVEAVFSYDFAKPAALDTAATTHLTGAAVAQHRALLATVRAQGPGQKLVLTTTVTHSGVELIDGDRARILVYADQSNTRTAGKQETTYAGALLAVDAVRKGATWRIGALDTLGQGS
ncbi:hypothetical protein ACFVIM_15120 [Streptomyces sp. NPDC057638]|uniref:hypothetical protein n=1 Tax=Streptomyces sp. NPDC057638 TaxID=3346190 RepID=UPI003685E0BC